MVVVCSLNVDLFIKSHSASNGGTVAGYGPGSGALSEPRPPVKPPPLRAFTERGDPGGGNKHEDNHTANNFRTNL